eukprot:13875503-Ditylum_brightwellii.AAC.1
MTALALRPVSDQKDDLPHGEEFDSIAEEPVAQLCNTALKKQSGALSMPCLSSPTSKLKMEGRLWSSLHNNLLEPKMARRVMHEG